MPSLHAPAHAVLQAASPALRVGIDTVMVDDVRESLARFGPRYAQRLFTAHECAYALAVPELAAERLAARFAAKEAAIKAFDLGEAGVSWRDIEVRRQPNGACSLALHGRAAQVAATATGPCHTALSLSHDQAHAMAVVVALPVPSDPTHHRSD